MNNQQLALLANSSYWLSTPSLVGHQDDTSANVPRRPVIQLASWSNDSNEGQALVTVSGTGLAGSTVYVYMNRGTLSPSANGTGHLLGQATVNADGTWSVSLNSKVDTGKWVFSAVAADQQGTESLRAALRIINGPIPSTIQAIPRAYHAEMQAVWERYLASHPGASDAAKAFMNQTLQAYGYMVTERSGDRGSGWNRSTLFNTVSQATSWGSEGLAGAYLWAGQGMFSLGDRFGNDLATPYGDGSMNPFQLLGWASGEKNAAVPTTTQDVLKLLNAAAVNALMQGEDIAHLNGDVFVHPQSYTAKQKAAVYFRLQQIAEGIVVLYESGAWDRVWYLKELVAHKPTAELASLRKAMATLASDVAVQHYIDTEHQAELRKLVRGELYIELAKHLEQLESKAYIDQILSGATGGRLGSAFLNWADEVKQVREALYTPGEEGPSPVALLKQGSPSPYDTAAQYYQQKIVSGDFLRERISAGASLAEALTEFGAEVAGLTAVLDPTLIKQYQIDLRDNLAQATNELLISQLTQADLTQYLLDANGNADATKIEHVMWQLSTQDPDALKDDEGHTISAKDVVKLIQLAWDQSGRQPQKLGDAVTKLFTEINRRNDWNLPTGFKPASMYARGSMHLVAAMLGGIGMMTRFMTGTTSTGNPNATSTAVADNVKAFSLLLEGTGKWSKTRLSTEALQTRFNNATFWTRLEGLGKGLGGAASVVGSVFGIIEGVNNLSTDRASGAFSITTGVLGLVSGAAALTEGVTAFFSSSLATLIGSVAASAGAVFGVVGDLATVAQLLYEGIMTNIRQNAQIAQDNLWTSYVNRLTSDMSALGLSRSNSATLSAAADQDLFINAEETSITVALRLDLPEFANAGDTLYLSPRIDAYNAYPYGSDPGGPFGNGPCYYGDYQGHLNWLRSTVYVTHVLTQDEVDSGAVTLSVDAVALPLSGTFGFSAYVFRRDESDGIDHNPVGDLNFHKPYAISNAIQVTVDKITPATPVVTARVMRSIAVGAVAQPYLSLTGTGEAGTLVYLMQGHVLVATAKVQADGQWSMTDAEMAGDEYTGHFTLFAQDAANNRSAAVDVMTQARANLLGSNTPPVIGKNGTWTRSLSTVAGKVYDLVMDARQTSVNGDAAIEIDWNGQAVGIFSPIKLNASVSDTQRYMVSVLGNGATSTLSIKPKSAFDIASTVQVSGMGVYETWKIRDLVGNAASTVLTGNDDDNHLSGGAGNDTLNGGGGADLLTDAAGNDTYNFGRGGGQDTIQDKGGKDTLNFATGGINPSQLWFMHAAETDDLEISVIGTADKITVRDWYRGTTARIETIKTTTVLGDIRTLSCANVENLVAAMAGFAPPPLGQTNLDVTRAATLLPILNSVWS